MVQSIVQRKRVCEGIKIVTSSPNQLFMPSDIQTGCLACWNQLQISFFLSTTTWSPYPLLSTLLLFLFLDNASKATQDWFRKVYHWQNQQRDGFKQENNRGGHPSKLSCHNKQSINCQITTGKLVNAVQATNFINNIISSPVTPQTVRNSLKENNFHSVVKQKHC